MLNPHQEVMTAHNNNNNHNKMMIMFSDVDQRVLWFDSPSGKTVGRSQAMAQPLFIGFQTFCFFPFIFLGIFVGNIQHKHTSKHWGPGNRLSGGAGSAHTVYNVMRVKGEGAGLTSSRPGCR